MRQSHFENAESDGITAEKEENQTFFQVKMKDILYEMSITSENVTPKGS